MIGIYKITSPTGKVYIGQSIDIEKRKSSYINLDNVNIKRQPKIYNSLLKHGPDNHKFEIIEECNIEQLNERETYWKQYYIDLYSWKQVLFCELYDLGGGPKSNETREKISKSMLGIKRSEETKTKHRKPKTKTHSENIKIGLTGLIRTEETKILMSLNIKGKKLGKSSIGSGRKTGFKMSEEHKQKLREAKLGKPSNHKKQLI